MKSLLILSLLALTVYTVPNADCWSCEMTTDMDWDGSACNSGTTNTDPAATCFAATWAAG